MFSKQETHKGLGLFATRQIQRGETVELFFGSIFQLNAIPKEVDKYAMQIYHNTYIAPEMPVPDVYFINHSCNPNCGISLLHRDTTPFLKTIKKVEAGEELTFDYSTTQIDKDWSMECQCQSKNCRGIISDITGISVCQFVYYSILNVIPLYAQGEYLHYTYNRKNLGWSIPHIKKRFLQKLKMVREIL